MIQFKRPMLAAPLLPPHVEHTDDNVFAAMKQLRFPVLATLKKDGIRGLRLNGSLLSRTLKPIPNKSIRERSLVMPGGFDMELWNKELQYDEVESIVMSRKHSREGEIEFHVLDWYKETISYAERCKYIMVNMPELQQHKVKFSPPLYCDNAEQLFAFEQICIEQAGEGICFRTPNSPYKQGRSTLKEQYLVKLSRFVHAEAIVVGFIEQQENTNSSKWNAVGNMDRSSEKDGMVGKDTLGAFIVEDIKTGMEFKIGTGVGLTDKFRKHIWENKQKYLQKIVSYKCKPHGQKVKPRSPIFKGFRNPIDL